MCVFEIWFYLQILLKIDISNGCSANTDGQKSKNHRSPVHPPYEGQWRGVLMFSLIYVWMNSWENNIEAGLLKRHCAHYDVTVMIKKDGVIHQPALRWIHLLLLSNPSFHLLFLIFVDNWQVSIISLTYAKVVKNTVFRILYVHIRQTKDHLASRGSPQTCQTQVHVGAILARVGWTRDKTVAGHALF